MRESAWFAAIGVAVSLSACGGKVGDAARPEEKSASDVMGEETPPFDCTEVAPASEPLIVDWPSERRLDLSIALRQGVAVVRYDCDGMELLKRCAVKGQYSFVGTPVIENVVELASEDSVRASLPTTGAELSASARGESKIDIAIALVGRRSTLVGSVRKDQLEGECEGATHYVRGAYVGAFRMGQGTEGQAAGSAELFGAGAGGESKSSKRSLSKDGDLAACKSSSPDADEPPPQCSSHVRLDLAPLGAPAVAEAEKANEPLQNTCADGFVFADGACKRKGEATAYRCDPKNQAECEEQCERGNPDSCYNVGQLLTRSGIRPPGEKAPPGKDYKSMKAKARPYYEKACAGDVGLACNRLASYHTDDGEVAKAEQILQRACFELTTPLACGNLAMNLTYGRKGWKKDPQRALALHARACKLGSAGGCSVWAEMLIEGKGGIGKDAASGVEILTRACDESMMPSPCEKLSKLYAVGGGIPVNKAKAEEYLEKACSLGLIGSVCKK